MANTDLLSKSLGRIKVSTVLTITITPSLIILLNSLISILPSVAILRILLIAIVRHVVYYVMNDVVRNRGNAALGEILIATL